MLCKLAWAWTCQKLAEGIIMLASVYLKNLDNELPCPHDLRTCFNYNWQHAMTNNSDLLFCWCLVLEIGPLHIILDWKIWASEWHDSRKHPHLSIGLDTEMTEPLIMIKQWAAIKVITCWWSNKKYLVIFSELKMNTSFKPFKTQC